MIRRARFIAILVAFGAALIAALVWRFVAPGNAVHAWAVGLGAGVVALVASEIVLASVRATLADLAKSVQDSARDTSRPIPIPDAPPEDEARRLAEWTGFLAADADRSHKALARERVLLQAVAEGLTQGVIAVDGDHKVELLNDAARGMLGVTTTPVGEPLIELVRIPEVFALLDSEQNASAEVQLQSGHRTLIRVARKWGGEGRVLLLEDVTAMRHLERVRRDFVANVSHELRTPVAVIRANAETLLAGAMSDPKFATRLVDGLHRNAERLARIIADLLDLSRLDAGQYRLESVPVALPTAVTQALTAVETAAAQREVKVAVNVPEDLVVRGDAKALDQILVNLIDNAVKYTRPAGNVWVEARSVSDDGVRIEVRDDGPGISAKHRERVFERFYRADPSRSREAGGTGLGLSIVKHLAESMDGKVGVAPNEPTGSTFWLQLPKAVVA